MKKSVSEHLQRYSIVARVISLLVMALLFFNGIVPAAWAMPVAPAEMDDLLNTEESGEIYPNLARTAIFTYVAQPGDTLWSIAAQFGLDVDTLRWSNPALIHDPDLLSVGQELVILPVPGAYVTVRPGDTIERLAARWGVAPADIANYPLNRLRQGEEPSPGTKLVIPHGRQDVNLLPPGLAEGYAYAWPVRGRITQGYWAKHHAIDIGAPYGAKVYASRAGRCVYAAWSQVCYGYLVILRHDDGSRTYYGHLKGALVIPGQWVKRGGLVGEVGSTGNSTGPHVHFEIRIGGVRQNPLNYLPPKP